MRNSTVFPIVAAFICFSAVFLLYGFFLGASPEGRAVAESLRDHPVEWAREDQPSGTFTLTNTKADIVIVAKPSGGYANPVVYFVNRRGERFVALTRFADNRLVDQAITRHFINRVDDQSIDDTVAALGEQNAGNLRERQNHTH